MKLSVVSGHACDGSGGHHLHKDHNTVERSEKDHVIDSGVGSQVTDDSDTAKRPVLPGP